MNNVKTFSVKGCSITVEWNPRNMNEIYLVVRKPYGQEMWFDGDEARNMWDAIKGFVNG